MPRKQRVVKNENSLSDIKTEEEGLEKLPRQLRRSRRKTAIPVLQPERLSNHLKCSSLKLEETIKLPKVANKKVKVKGDEYIPNFIQDSPDSTDSGIGSGHSTKDESNREILPISKFSTPVLKIPIIERNSELATKACNEFKAENDSVHKQVPQKEAQQRKSKRKIIDLNNELQTTDGCSAKKTKLFSKNYVKPINTGDKKMKSSLNKSNSSFESSHDSDSINNNEGASPTKEDNVLQVLTQHEFASTSNADISDLRKSENTCDGSSSDSDWEEVEDKKEQNLEDYNPVIPKDGVEITIDCPDLNSRKRKKKQFDEVEYIRLYINRERKEHQLNAYKTHMLCLLAHGFFVNDILNSSLLKAFALSFIPDDISTKIANKKVDKVDYEGIENFLYWFRNEFEFENKQHAFLNFKENFSKSFQNQKSLNCSEYNLMFIVVARTLGFKTRMCISFYPITHKAQNLLKKNNSKKKENSKHQNLSKEAEENSSEVACSNEKNTPKESKHVQQAKSKKKKIVECQTKQKSYSKRSVVRNCKISSDEDFVVEDKKLLSKKSLNKSSLKKQYNRKILSSDSSPERSVIKCDKIVCWAEVFCKPSRQWISVECASNIVNKPYDIEKLLPQPVAYILAFDNESYVKDITRRYCSEYMTSTIKLRPDSEWLEETLEPYLPPNSKLNKEEESKLDEMLINKPLPKTVSGFKNHPLYALKRHLLKFEAIYPPDAAPVGFLREEPIYARECVCQLHSRETWVKEARVVRVGEEPYKIVKARPKWDKIACVLRTDLPLEIFGLWQTEPYKPPVAVGGKVPRNEYGNVELFKPCMLPKGTVHLQIPGLNRIAKKLDIDCSPAVVGFDGHKGSVHPVFDGFVVCKEFKETLLAAWEEEQENARKREEEKREKRIYGNWKKLIRGLLIREKIKLKYDVK